MPDPCEVAVHPGHVRHDAEQTETQQRRDELLEAGRNGASPPDRLRHGVGLDWCGDRPYGWIRLGDHGQALRGLLGHPPAE
jgi:hypothetical protein